MKLGKTLHVTTRRAWRSWLARHHRTAPEIWLIFYKKSSGRARIPYNDAVEEALCYGWIDSIVKSVDDRRYAQRFSPRRPTSRLSELNRERVRRLVAAGRMTKAGLASIAHAYEAGGNDKASRWTLPADIRKRLEGEPEAWKNFKRFPASYKRIRIGWITAARPRPTVFEQRLRYFIRMTARNKRFGMVQ